MSEAANKEMITDAFVRGARQGWGIAVGSMIPNVMMAFVLIKGLQILGWLTVIGNVCGPVMNIWGLPGEALTVLIAGWLSIGGGVGVAVALFSNGILDGTHIAVMAPAIVLMGSQLQYMGRCLGVCGIPGKLIPVMMGLSVVAACASMFVMRVIV